MALLRVSGEKIAVARSMVTWEGWEKRVGSRRSRISLSWLEYVGSGPLKGCFVGIFSFFHASGGRRVLAVAVKEGEILVVAFHTVVSSIKRKRLGQTLGSGHVSFLFRV